jgi:hypothetical protein
MTALQIGDPMALVVLMESHDPSLHNGHSSG